MLTQKSKSIFYLFCLIVLVSSSLFSCARPAPGTYADSPSSREDKLNAKDIKMEIFILENSSIPVTDMEVKVSSDSISSSQSSKTRTNFKGRARVTLKRPDSAPIKFVFKKDGYTSIEIIHTIPSNVSDVGIVFSFDAPGKVRFVNYTVKGLYR